MYSNWFAVASIIEQTLTTLNAFLRSDNAGCHHGAYLILSLPSIGVRAGIMIKRYDLSDLQAGKDICYRRTAALKTHMRRYINKGKIFYCLSVNLGQYNKENIAQLQKVQTFEASVATESRKFDHITPTLKQLQ